MATNNDKLTAAQILGEIHSRRRQRNRRDDYYNSKSSVSVVLESKAVMKTPLRFIPDAAGFSALSKTEIKKDTKEIERNAIYMVHSDSDSEEEFEKYVEHSQHPLCSDDSNAIKKRRRLTNWASNNSLMHHDLAVLKTELNTAREEFSALSNKEDKWLGNFEHARRLLTRLIFQFREDNAELRKTCRQLYEANVAECGNSMTTTRKRRVAHMQMRDIIDELEDRKLMLENRIREYEKLIHNSSAAAASSHPVMRLEVDEMYDGVDLDPSKSKNCIHCAPCVRSGDNSDCSHGSKESLEDAAIKKESKVEEVAGENSIPPSLPTNGSTITPNSKKVTFVSQIHAEFASAEQSIQLAELALRDLEVYYLDEHEGEALYPEVNVSPNPSTSHSNAFFSGFRKRMEKPHPWTPFLDPSQQKDIADAFLQLRGQQNRWEEYIADFVVHQDSLTRRKRRGPGLVPLSSFCMAFTPRERRLLVSPLSAFEDRYLGELLGPLNDSLPSSSLESSTADNTSIAYRALRDQYPELVAEEDAVLAKCQLQAVAAIADTRKRRLRAALVDWKKLVQEGQQSYLKARQIYQGVVSDDRGEVVRLVKDLMHMGHLQFEDEKDSEAVRQFLKSGDPLGTDGNYSNQGSMTNGLNPGVLNGSTTNNNGKDFINGSVGNSGNSNGTAQKNGRNNNRGGNKRNSRGSTGNKNGLSTNNSSISAGNGSGSPNYHEMGLDTKESVDLMNNQDEMLSEEDDLENSQLSYGSSNLSQSKAANDAEDTLMASLLLATSSQGPSTAPVSSKKKARSSASAANGTSAPNTNGSSAGATAAVIASNEDTVTSKRKTSRTHFPLV